MYLIVIAWVYVVLMMVVAEATSPAGTLLGALFTGLLYGVLPLSIVVYLMRSPARRRAQKAKQAADLASEQGAAEQALAARQASASSAQPDASGETATGLASPSAQAPSDAPVREKP